MPPNKRREGDHRGCRPADGRDSDVGCRMVVRGVFKAPHECNIAQDALCPNQQTRGLFIATGFTAEAVAPKPEVQPNA